MTTDAFKYAYTMYISQYTFISLVLYRIWIKMHELWSWTVCTHRIFGTLSQIIIIIRVYNKRKQTKY